ncbi:AI-2E family transporter [Lachnospiraceae bacterium OttesenSCG-928-D06]|nr:AI-2E family transporter [Lachnospiraceae bacterium OttesenSCG-928-D06]
MGYEKRKIKQIRGLMIFAAILILMLIYSDYLFSGVAFLYKILKPFMLGAAIAFVLNLPMRAVENKLLKKWNGKIGARLKRPVSLLLAALIVILIIFLVFATVIPQVTKTVGELGGKIPAFAEQVVLYLNQISVDYPQFQEEITKLTAVDINWNSVLDTAYNFLTSGVMNMVTSTVNVASGIVGAVVNFVVAFIFSIYILLQKERLSNQLKRFSKAFFPEKVDYKLSYVMSLLHKNFSNFITVQCLEAVILGAMFVVSMTIFRMPYAVLVGVLIAFTALIPVVGAFIGCSIGAFLILIDNPIQALWFVILFLILQQIEGNLIYPRVVGSSVGLPSIWVLFAVSVGGSLFGIGGMLFFIPLLSTIYTLLRDSVNERNKKRENSKKIVSATEEDKITIEQSDLENKEQEMIREQEQREITKRQAENAAKQKQKNGKKRKKHPEK